MDEAKARLEEALREKEDSPELYEALALAHAKGGEFQSAVEAARRSLELKPDNPPLRARLAEMERLRAAVESGEFHKGP